MDIMVLCYHAVSPTWPASLSVTPDALEQQLSMLVSKGWRGATFSDAVLSPSSGRRLVVTFDDGFRSVYDLARPILDSLGLPATVFVPTSFPADGGPLHWSGIDHWASGEHASELACMTWPMLSALHDQGWEIGSHTLTHPVLPTLDAVTLRNELQASRQQISDRLGVACTSIAYPYGAVDHRVAEAAAVAGYVAGASLSRRLPRLGPLRWPRLGIYHLDRPDRFRLKTARSVRWVRAARLWQSY